MADDAITFGQRGQIRRGDILVGWIEKRDDMPPTTWRLRLTPASGSPGIKGEFPRRKDARAEALRLLETMNQQSI
ncbi:hypothetical protein HUE56_04490 (plasmid) [Azospirillum oryzae]|uniref:Uncharacterized protein n=1 Tax=Azospirillum oryzae TaxID=286727 RepID=A0A6N1AHE3_9PROT|nr:hypothetical protein [Azospirillum oryzae]KAA0584520.1 hypothetical protein FZ938_29560 [Azospirillum oryzae]QKS49797.1 hypothetical protein HUE56_04490 [Azospirillum oryzae]GLR79058.1 hypothetical protein GCM10007856_17320 [Azospirillum oryzae]